MVIDSRGPATLFCLSQEMENSKVRKSSGRMDVILQEQLYLSQTKCITFYSFEIKLTSKG